MSDILCQWLNQDVQLSKNIEIQNISNAFSNGYLIGEVLYKYGLQNDFNMFSSASSSESKLNNFTRIEPVLGLLDVKFDTNMASEIMNERPGMATRLLYQLFIALGKKTKMNLTGVAMETMRPIGPARLGVIESDLYKERLKTMVPRQVDLDFDNIVSKYDDIQKEQEKKSLKSKLQEEEITRKYQQAVRQEGLERSRKLREKQNEVMSKIKEATVKVPKIPEQRVNGKTKKEICKEKEIQSVYQNIDAFEKNLQHLRTISPQSSDQIKEMDNDIANFLNESSVTARQPSVQDFVKPSENKVYVSNIREKLNSDAVARQEREKRRRKVLMDQMTAHEAQQEQQREDILVKRLMRQSQMEKRIAVQLMGVRKNKSVIKQNRLEMERQYTERRLKDFDDALNREAELCRLARLEYVEEIEKNKQLHAAIAKERAEKKYQKHYDVCLKITNDIIDFVCKVGEYRELTEKFLPAKLIREWKALFIESKPLYDDPTCDLTEEEFEQLQIEESRQTILDEEDFNEYKNFVGEWLPESDSNLILPGNNNILGFVLTRLEHILHPPTPPPEVPKFPEFPIKACVLGKYFAGKTTAIKEIVATHRIVLIDVENVVFEAIEAWKNKEKIMVPIDDTSDKNIDISKTEDNNNTNNISEDKEVAEKDNEKAQEIDNSNEKKETPTKQLTLKAQLGEKVDIHLRKGTSLPDHLLVEVMVEHVRNIPDGTGWIMDGFPSTINQAKLLEKALTGYEPTPSPHKSSTREKRGRKSKLANDPRPTPESKPPTSGIHVVVLFDIDDNIVLQRSEGRTVDPATGETFHEEFKKPPHGNYTGLQKKSKIQPVIDGSNDKEQAQTRLTSFQENWPKLEKWFNKFDILTKLNANQPTDNICEHLKDILDTTLRKLVVSAATSKEDMPDNDKSDKEGKEKNDENKVSPTKEGVSSQSDKDLINKDIDGENNIVEKSVDYPMKQEDSKTISKKNGKKSPSNSSGSPTRKGKRERTPSPVKRKESASKSRSVTPRRSKSKNSSSKMQVQMESEEKKVDDIEKSLSPEPGSLEWVFVEQPIDEEFVAVLLSNWELIESTYISSCKHVFRKIRTENETIYQYFYSTRQNFIQFLKRPDEKQEFVSQWQKDFNDFPLDMRSDEESKAELHQRVDDLCERLWDICDFRKEENESERSSIMTEGWLEDHLGLLTNHFISIMQSEVDRYQQTCKLLKDYYVAMEGGVGPKKLKLISDVNPDFARLALIDLPPTQRKETETNMDEDDLISTSAVVTKPPIRTPDVHLDGKLQHNVAGRIPLVPRRPQSQELSPSRNEKKKSTPRREKSSLGGFSEEKMESPAPPVDLEEKLIVEAVQTSVKVIDKQHSMDLQEEDADHSNHLKEKMNELSKVASKDKKGKKGDKKSPTKSKTQVNPSPTLQSHNSVETVSEEEKLNKKIEENIKKEYKVAVQEEGNGLRQRLEAIQMHACTVIKNLKEKAQGTYGDMDNWLGIRFHQEMESIEKMSDLIRHAIENENQLQDAVILKDKDFFINEDMHVFKTPTPPQTPPPAEVLYEDLFTCVQLNALVKQLREVSPSGITHRKIFHNFITDQTKSILGGENVPLYWQNISSQQLEEIINILYVTNEFINWKSFIVLLAYPNLETSQAQLLAALNEFKLVDHTDSGVVMKKDYDFVDIWLNEEANKYSGEYDRAYNLKNIFFNVFSYETSEGDLLDYRDMLLYLIGANDHIHGVIMALTVITGVQIPLDYFNDVSSPNEEGIDDSIEVNVTIEQLFKVFNHTMNGRGGSHRFDNNNVSTPNTIQEHLKLVFKELGCNEDDSISLKHLYEHPIVRDLIDACHVFKRKDFMQVFMQNKTTEEVIADV